MTLRDLVPNPALREQIQGWKKLYKDELACLSETDACSEDDDDDEDFMGPVVCLNASDVDQFIRDEKAAREARASRRRSAATADEVSNTTARQGRRRGFLGFGRRQKA